MLHYYQSKKQLKNISRAIFLAIQGIEHLASFLSVAVFCFYLICTNNLKIVWDNLFL